MNCMMNIGQINTRLLFINIKKGNTSMAWRLHDFICLNPLFIENPEKLLNITNILDIPKAITEANVIFDDFAFYGTDLSFSPQEEWIFTIWKDVTNSAKTVTLDQLSSFYDKVADDERFQTAISKAEVTEKNASEFYDYQIVYLEKFGKYYAKSISGFRELLIFFEELETLLRNTSKNPPLFTVTFED